MSATVTATGNIGQEPEIKYSQGGTAYLNLSIAVTPRRFNKQTSQWENKGDDAWLRATFFNDQAEKWGEVLHKGMQITVSGTLMRREWTSQDGRTGESWELDNARFLGIVPKAENPSQASQDQFSGGYSPQTPTYPPNARNTPQNGAQGFGNDPAGNLANVEQTQLPPF